MEVDSVGSVAVEDVEASLGIDSDEGNDDNIEDDREGPGPEKPISEIISSEESLFVPIKKVGHLLLMGPMLNLL